MSDEPQEAWGFPLTPEQQVKIRMEQTALRHQLDSWLSGMSKEDLLAFKIFLTTVSAGHGDLVSIFLGHVSALLQVKYEVCPSCGINHEEEEMNKLAAENPDIVPKPAEDKVDLTRVNKEQGDQIIQLINSSHTITPALLEQIRSYKVTPPLTSLEIEMMDKYHLDDLWKENDDDGNKLDKPMFSGYICKKCKMPYASIQDRMLRKPDECRGCFIKAAHG